MSRVLLEVAALMLARTWHLLLNRSCERRRWRLETTRKASHVGRCSEASSPLRRSMRSCGGDPRGSGLALTSSGVKCPSLQGSCKPRQVLFTGHDLLCSRHQSTWPTALASSMPSDLPPVQ